MNFDHMKKPSLKYWSTRAITRPMSLPENHQTYVPCFHETKLSHVVTKPLIGAFRNRGTLKNEQSAHCFTNLQSILLDENKLVDQIKMFQKLGFDVLFLSAFMTHYVL